MIKRDEQVELGKRIGEALKKREDIQTKIQGLSSEQLDAILKLIKSMGKGLG
ncbi:MAG: hypothetical protein HXX80_00085 [Nitrososphaerales archaeon]|nr:hypothetical protein [Nitrososphaerales archaeon]